jgi:DNA-binding HxlR family transcriptional regulator
VEGRSSPGPWGRWEGDDADSIRQVIARVGEPWGLLIIGALEPGPLRYGELADAVPGIPERVLSPTLQRLVEDGILSRAAYAEAPPRVEYELASLGRALLPVALGLVTWSEEHHEEILRNREAFAASLKPVPGWKPLG